MGSVTQKWVEIMTPFSRGYSVKLTASEISKKIKIPQQTVSRILNDLVQKNILSYVKKGKNKSYYLEIKRLDTKIIFNILENQKALNFQLKNKKIAIILNELLKFCEGLIIFGSYSSGIPRKDSDLDLVILGKHNKLKIKEIKKRQTIKINEHYISFKEFEKILRERNPLAIEILENHILLGDVSRIVNLFWRREYERR